MRCEPAEFEDPGGSPYRVLLAPDAVASILAAARGARALETGGILVGRYAPDGWTAEITEATPKPRGSRAGAWWFTRGTVGLHTLLQDRWATGCHYLGEWHYHPRGSPRPSETDKRTMRRIASDPDYHCDRPVLVILGGCAGGTWRLSASVFEAGIHLPLRQLRS